jgi:hypothetical protein
MTKQPLKITVKHYERDGRQIVAVPLKNNVDKFVIMSEADYDHLLTLGVHPIFIWKGGAVWCRGKQPGKPVTDYVALSRVLLDAGIGQCCRFLDRNPCNLLRENCILTYGRSRYRARDQIAQRFSQQFYEVEHVYDHAA